MAVALAAAAVIFYFVSLRKIAARFTEKREQLMAVVEGRA
jgi:preprotein translocase subunit YajC